MDNPIQQDRLGLESSFAAKDLGILVSNKLNRNQPCSLAAKSSCTLNWMSRTKASRSRGVIIKDVLDVQTARAGKGEIMLHRDHLNTF